MRSQAYLWERKRCGTHKKRDRQRKREESKAAASRVLVAARSWEIFPWNSGVSKALSTPPVQYYVSL